MDGREADAPCKEFEDRFRRGLELMVHNERYQSRVVCSEPGLLVGFAGYEQYPSQVWEEGNLFVMLEGMVYDKLGGELRSWALNLARAWQAGEISFTGRLADALLGADGDFVIIVLDRARRLGFLATDALGRLPCYFGENETRWGTPTWAVSREVKFVASVCSLKELDRTAVAEYLLFRYPLEDRTLLRGVRRLAPATLLEFGWPGVEPRARTVLGWNFETRNGPSAADQARTLPELFLEGCAARFGGGLQPVISLSGGMDSRLVAAGLMQVAGRRPRIADHGLWAATFDTGRDGRAELDAAIAPQVAVALGIEWQLFRLSGNPPDSARRLVRLKDGLNYASMGFILEFLETLIQQYGADTAYWTGDGDAFARCILPRAKSRSLQAVADYILAGSVFPVRLVERILDIEPGRIRKTILGILGRYPEPSLEGKYVHHQVMGREYKWHLEGQDRNRFFLWPVAPLYSLPFVRCCMSCPQEDKKDHRFYRLILETIAPRLLEIPGAQWNASLGSRQAALKRAISGVSAAAKARLPFLSRAVRSLLSDLDFRPDPGLNEQVLDLEQHVGDWGRLSLRRIMASCRTMHQFMTAATVSLFAAQVTEY